MKPKIEYRKNVTYQIAYIRFTGSYIEFRRASRQLFKTLFTWAEKNNLIIPDVTKVLTIYNDNPYITADKNLRTSIALTLPEATNIQGDESINIMTLTGDYAVGRFIINQKEYGEAWTCMYQTLNDVGIPLDDKPPFELYVTEPPKNAKDTSETDIYIPILR